jgi:hypothetical protein
MKNAILGLSVLWMIVFSVQSMQAQDYIYLQNGSSRLATKNVKVGVGETRYQLFEGSTEATFALDNKDISLIAFEDGSIRLFSERDRIKSVYQYKKNLFTFHLFDLIVNEFTISYERIISKGKMGLQIPLSVGFSDANINGFDDIENKFYSGLNVNFYPTGQGKVRYFLGPGVQIGTGSYDVHYYQSTTVSAETFFFRFFVNNGLVISPVPDMSLSAVGSIGVRYLENPDENHEELKTVGAFAFNLSYRF